MQLFYITNVNFRQHYMGKEFSNITDVHANEVLSKCAMYSITI